MRSYLPILSTTALLSSFTCFAAPSGPTVIAAKCCNAGSTISVFSTAPANLAGTFASGTLETQIVFAPGGKIAFLADAGANAVRLVEVQTRRTVATVHLAAAPVNLALSPDTTRLYVSLLQAGVAVIDTATLSVIDTITEPNPSGLAVSPDGKTLFVGNISATETGYIDAVNTTTFQITGSFPLAAVQAPGTIVLAITPDGKQVYAIFRAVQQNAGGFLDVLNVASGSVATLGALNPLSLAISPDGQFVYEGDYFSAINIYPTATNKPGPQILTPSSVNALALTLDGSEFVIDGATGPVTNAVSFLSVATGTVTSQFPASYFAGSLAVFPSGNGVYVLNSGPTEVLFASGETVTGAFKQAAAPYGVAASSSLGFAYISDQKSDSVSVVDISTHKLVTTIGFSAGPTGDLVLSPDSSKLYVLVNAPQNPSIQTVDTATNLVTGNIDFPFSPSAISLAISPDGKQLFVTFAQTPNVTIVDAATLSITGGFGLGVPNPYSRYVAITPDNKTAYVTTANYLVAVNIPSGTIKSTLGVGSCSQRVSITPDGSQVWLADADGKQIDVISTATNSVIATIAVPGGPNRIAFTKDGAEAYVTEAGCVCCSTSAAPGNKILAIDTATFKITGAIPAGGETQGIAVLP